MITEVLTVQKEEASLQLSVCDGMDCSEILCKVFAGKIVNLKPLLLT